MDYQTPEIKSIIEKSNYIRGEFLNLCIILERRIDTFLITYFSPVQFKQDEIMELLVDRIGLENKRTSLLAILNKSNTDVDFKKKYKTLNSDLLYLIKHRNYFAHYSVSTSDEAIKRFPKEIGLIHFRDNVKIHWYDNEKIEKLRNLVDKCDNVIQHAILNYHM